MTFTARRLVELAFTFDGQDVVFEGDLDVFPLHVAINPILPAPSSALACIITGVAQLFHGGATDLTEDARELLSDLDHEIPGASSVAAGCRPPIDVIETATSIEVLMDAPGVPASSIRVAIRRSTMLIAGAKPGGPKDAAARYHLAERTSGRFARAVRLGGAFDGTRARAVIHDGQLRIVLPLLQDRRGQLLMIPVEQE